MKNILKNPFSQAFTQLILLSLPLLAPTCNGLGKQEETNAPKPHPQTMEQEQRNKEQQLTMQFINYTNQQLYQSTKTRS